MTSKDEGSEKEKYSSEVEGLVTEEIEQLVKEGGVIPDSKVKEVLEHAGVDLKDEVCKEAWLETPVPTKLPPYYWDGTNTNSSMMAKYMFGEDKVYTGGHPSVLKEVYPKEIPRGHQLYVGTANRFKMRRTRYNLLINELKIQFKQDIGLDLGLAKIKGNVKSDRAGLANIIEPKRIVNLVCLQCADPEKAEFSPVVRVKCNAVDDEDDPNKIVYSFSVLNVYFHDSVCTKHPGKVSANGYQKVPCGSEEDGSKKESLRSAAFDRWIKFLHIWDDPEKQMPYASEINFGTQKHQFDKRLQVPIYEEVDLPREIREKPYIAFVAWRLMEVICKRNLTQEWTREIPARYPSRTVETAQKEYPLAPQQNNNLPVHLFMKGGLLLLGGIQLDKENPKKLEKVQAHTHQPAHTDIVNMHFNSCGDCPLLHGLNHPLTFNIAIEDERSIWVNDVTNVVKMDKNDMLVISADTVHGGMSYVFAPKPKPKTKSQAKKAKLNEGPEDNDVTWKPKYHPSFHGVLSSKRFPPTNDQIKYAHDLSSYLPRTHLGLLDEEEVCDLVRLIHKKMQDVAAHCKKNLKDSTTKKVLNAYKPGMNESETIYQAEDNK
jgi:hypothetical protein